MNIKRRVVHLEGVRRQAFSDLRDDFLSYGFHLS